MAIASHSAPWVDAWNAFQYFTNMSTALKLDEPQLISWENYESMESRSQQRHEYVNGQVYARAGASWNHNRVAGNVFGELRQQLRGKRCEAFMADLKLRIDLRREQFGYYPDVMVVCDPKDQGTLPVTNPTVVFEVLSKSTARIDRREKLLAYPAVPSLMAYVLLEQSQPVVTIHRRSDQWQAETVVGLQAVLALPEVGAELPLSLIYERVNWGEVEADDEVG